MHVFFVFWTFKFALTKLGLFRNAPPQSRFNFVFKILKVFVDVDTSEFCERITSAFVTRGHRYKLVHSSVRINVRQHFFAVWIIPVWNSLSSNVVEAESISCFKARLSKASLTKFVHFLLYFYFILVCAVFTIGWPLNIRKNLFSNYFGSDPSKWFHLL